MRKIISCVIGIALLFTSIFPGNLIDYKINTEQQEDKILINEELLYRGKDIEELKAIIPYTYKMLIVNDKDCSIIDSINLNEINEIHIQYEKELFDINLRTKQLEQLIYTFEHPNTNKLTNILKPILGTPSIFLSTLYFVAMKSFYESNGGAATKYEIAFGVSLLVLSILKIVIWEIFENKFFSIYDYNNIENPNINNTTLLVQYHQGYSDGFELLKKYKKDGITYLPTQKKSNLINTLSNYLMPLLYPLISMIIYHYDNTETYGHDDLKLFSYIIIPIIPMLLDIGAFSTCLIGRELITNHNDNIIVIQIYKTMNEKKDLSRSYLYGVHKAIFNSNF